VVTAAWSGSEADAFQQVLDDFTAHYGHRVEYISAGERIDALVRSRMRANRPPDIAILPSPGLLDRYRAHNWLHPLHTPPSHSPGDAWNALTSRGDQIFGVWVKATHKSLLWYRSERAAILPAQASSWRWDELVAWAADRARTGHPPLAIGAADGWVLTDWFENLLLSVEGGGEVYETLAAGDTTAWDSSPVQQTLLGLAELWSIEGVFPGGGRRALLTQNDEAVIQVFATQTADLIFEGDFVASVASAFHREGAEDGLRFLPFPRGDVASPPLVVGGDVAVLLRDSEPGQQLMSWLARPESFRPWLRRPGFLSPYPVNSDWYESPISRTLAQQLHSGERRLHFDLSDRLRGPLTGGDGAGLWRILQDFFAMVTSGDVAPRQAVDQVMRELARITAEEP